MTPLRQKPAYKVAAIQASPVYFDLEATLAKAIALTREAASNGATLVVFPELYLPGYPFYIWLDPYGKWTERTEGYYANCPAIDGPERNILVSLARELQITIVMGCGERDHGSLYMAQWIIGPEGLIAQRRKLKPSMMERVVFGEGDASRGLSNLEIGAFLKPHIVIPGIRHPSTAKETMLSDRALAELVEQHCREHNVPLIKHIMACQDEEVHCASWPHLHDNMPHHSLSRTANVGSNRAYAIEVGTFVVMATAPICEQNAQHLCGDDQTKRESLGMGGGCSMIYDPEGREIAEPLDEHAEGIVYATVDPVKCSLAKAALDTVGHYAREDVFRVTFDAEPRQSVKLHTLDPRKDQRFRISRTEMFSTATKRLGENAGAASVIRP